MNIVIFVLSNIKFYSASYLEHSTKRDFVNCIEKKERKLFSQSLLFFKKYSVNHHIKIQL